ncbi:TorF family putative porin [Mangrovibacter yixingensis]|uniref:TorF family putative porin n=1 Tax=Mangrovibacter yixingensis TaxID=1529639 RepID=UPI001CFC0C18|nr:TorF family putative porin [Mangrovibacter yixingensis]
MKKLISVISSLTLGVCLSLQPFSVNAWEVNDSLHLDTSISVLSDYRAFGVSSTQNKPTAQLSSVLTHSSGILAGIWASNVDYGTAARLESGYYAGYTRQLPYGFGFTTTLGQYKYPNQKDLDTNEFVANITYKNLLYGFVYDYDMEGIPNEKYHYVGYTFNLPADIGLYLEYGYDDMGFKIYNDAGNNRKGYNHWIARLSKTWWGIQWSLAYTDSNLSKTECVYVIGDRNSCGATVVAGITKNF